jgi:hypothetical protein
MGKEVGISDGALIVEAIGVEFGDGRSGDDDPFGETMDNDVEGQEECLIKVRRKTIVRRA